MCVSVGPSLVCILLLAGLVGLPFLFIETHERFEAERHDPNQIPYRNCTTAFKANCTLCFAQFPEPCRYCYQRRSRYTCDECIAQIPIACPYVKHCSDFAIQCEALNVPPLDAGAKLYFMLSVLMSILWLLVCFAGTTIG